MIDNLNIRYKIEVEGIDSFTQILPATITVDFIDGEVVIGSTSGATAVVDRPTSGTPDQIYIRTKEGFFIAEEELTSVGGGLAQKTGNIDILQAPYESTEFGIENGKWTLSSDEDLLTKISDPVQKINISQGGNLASGYSFGFEVTNFELAKALEVDGVFFRNRKCTLYLGTVTIGGTSWSSEWVGSIDSFDVSEKVVSFSCTDLTKMNTDNVGSDLAPITLNRNYNCKMILDGEEDANFDYVLLAGGNKIGYFIAKTEDKTGSSITIPFSQDVYDLIDSNEFNNIIVEVTFGYTSGVGNTYNVVKAENIILSGNDVHKIWLDDEDISGLVVTDKLINTGSSVIVLKKFNFTYNLSQNPVLRIHTDNNSNISLPLKINEDGINHFVSPKSHELRDGNQIIVKDIVDKDTMLFKQSMSDISYTQTSNGTGDSLGGNFNINVVYPDVAMQKLVDIQSNNDAVYFIPTSIKISNAIFSDDNFYDPITFETSDIIDKLSVRHVFSKYINGLTVNSAYNVYELYVDGGDVSIETKVTDGSLANHYDLEITLPYWNSFKSIFEIEETIIDSNSADSFTHFFQSKLKSLPGTPTTGGNLTRWSEYLTDEGNYATSFSYEGEKEISIDEISVGCNGENVYGETYDVATVPQTIEYLLKNYYDKTALDIDSGSFDQANEDFSLFVNDPVRNPAHQITEQTDGNELLSSILYANHLGMYINRSGQYALENWLPKSIVFSTTTTLADFDETNTISIGEIKSDNLNSVVSDFQLSMDLAESIGEYNRILRVKNTNESVFDFARDIEGVDANDEGLAFSAWQLANNGYNRINKLSQTTKESKWHKLAFSDGTGTSEAIAFIRNQLAHVNREHKFITFSVPYNTTNLGLELLSFISVSDQKITDDVARKGWIVERKLNLKTDTITWKLLLDISQFDPFLYQVNVWRDGVYLTNVKTDGDYPENIKANGTGIQ